MSVKALQAGLLAIAASMTLVWPAHQQRDARFAHLAAATSESAGTAAQAPHSQQTILQQESGSAHLRPQLRTFAAIAAGGAAALQYGVGGLVAASEAASAQSGLRLASPGRAPPAMHS